MVEMAIKHAAEGALKLSLFDSAKQQEFLTKGVALALGKRLHSARLWAYPHR